MRRGRGVRRCNRDNGVSKTDIEPARTGFRDNWQVAAQGSCQAPRAEDGARVKTQMSSGLAAE
jgi:hypothetical protein